MGVIRNTAAMRIRGKIGNTTYYTQGRRQIARVSENSSNYGEDARRSPAQQRRRVMWPNLVNFYKASTSWIHGAFETKKAAQSDYNKFMQLNVPLARIPLTKEQAEQGACVYDSFIVSQGSLPTIVLTRSNNTITTNIAFGWTQEEVAAGTLGQVSQVLINNNSFLANGCQLSFIGYVLTFGPNNIPSVVCHRAELCLDTASTMPMSSHPLGEVLGSASSHLAWLSTDPDSYYAIVLSDSTSGQLRVSSQRLVPGDEDIVATYANEAHIQAAIESYGVDAARFLDSGPEL